MEKESQLYSIPEARALNRCYSKGEVQGLIDTWSFDCPIQSLLPHADISKATMK